MRLTKSDITLLAPAGGKPEDLPEGLETEAHEDEGLETEAHEDEGLEDEDEGLEDEDEGLEDEDEGLEEDDIDPEAIFGKDMKFEVPELSLDQNDALAEVIEESLDELGAPDLSWIKPSTPIESYPYTPHPKARAMDTIIEYGDSASAEGKVSEARKNGGATSRALAGQLRRVLSARGAATTERDLRSGRLDRRKLHTVNAPGRRPNKRVFERTTPGQTNNVAIGLLVDQSGSMAEKMKITIESVVALGDALESLSSLGVSFGVWGFDSDYFRNVLDVPGLVDRTEPLRLHSYKGFSDPWTRVNGRVGHLRALLNNCDGECIRWAGQNLIAQKADRRILIVLSDGDPACRSSMSMARINADAKLAVSQLEGLGVETVGIGIQSGAVKKFYPNHLVINDVRGLEGALTRTLSGLFGLGRAA